MFDRVARLLHQISAMSASQGPLTAAEIERIHGGGSGESPEDLAYAEATREYAEAVKQHAKAVRSLNIARRDLENMRLLGRLFNKSA